MTSSTATECFVVEAPTVEAALEAVAAQVGPDCEIVDAEKVTKGGVAGFFGKESYRVTVREPAREAVDRVLDAADAAAPDAPAAGPADTFGEMFRRELGVSVSPPAGGPEPVIDLTDGVSEPATAVTGPPATGVSADALDRLRAAVAESRDEPATVEPDGGSDPAPALGSAPGHCGEPLWTPDALVRAGLPSAFVTHLGDMCDADEQSRLVRLSDALRPWCERLPADDTLVVGPHAARLAGALRLSVHPAGTVVPYRGSLIIECDPDDAGVVEYLQNVGAGRRIHLVSDGPDGFWGAEPEMVLSWTSDAGGVAALQLAIERGMYLGFDVRGPEPRRATPVELAIWVRSRLPLGDS